MTNQDIDFVIRTQDNPEGLTELLFSITDRYPSASITIADSGRELSRGFYKKLNTELQDAGLRSRMKVYFQGYNASFTTVMNAVMRMTKKRYMLLMDDSMVMTDQTSIEDMEHLMRFPKQKIGVVSGMTEPQQIQEAQKLGEVSYGFASSIPAFALFNMDVFHLVNWKTTERPLETLFANITSKTNFSVLQSDSIIGSSSQIVRENETTQEEESEEGAGEESEGPSAGESTEPTVQDSDAGDSDGADSVPGGKDEEEPNSSSRGGSRRSRSRSTRGKGNK